VITERKEHVSMLGEMLNDYMRVFVLTGGIKKKELIEIMDTLNKLDDNVKRVIIATSKFIGEGFDYPILDTLFITLPISWSGRIKQYAGRLHREYHEKKEVIIYDYVDSEIKLADKMFERRVKSYRSMGYEIINNI
jgi:superfamily II DNA or RNA helicase